MTSRTTRLTRPIRSLEEPGLTDTLPPHNNPIIPASRTIPDPQPSGINLTLRTERVNIQAKRIHTYIIQLNQSGSLITLARLIQGVGGSGQDTEIGAARAVDGGHVAGSADWVAETALVVEQVVAGLAHAGELALHEV